MLAMQFRLKTQKTRDSNWTEWSEWRYLKVSNSWSGIDVYSFALEYRMAKYDEDLPQFKILEAA